MVISSRTPEGQPNLCPVCGVSLAIEPSEPPGDAPCPRCGHLLWFTWEDLGDVRVIHPEGDRLDAGSLVRLIESLEMPTGTRLVFDLSHVWYLSSGALGHLIQLKRRLGRTGNRLRLDHVHPDLREVFRMTRLDQVFEVGE